MFVRKFKYTFKSLLRNKALIFWTFVFPLILVSFFKMAFSNLEKEERYNPSNIAIINDESFNEFIIYKETFKSLSDEKNDNRLFNVLYVDEEKAKKLLNDDEIIGYFSIKDDEPKVTVKQNGIYQTVLTSVVEEIELNKNVLNDYYSKVKLEENDAAVKNIMNKLNQDIKLKNVSNNNLSYTMIEYYTVIAMALLYGGMFAMTAINKEQANIDAVGKRNTIAPLNKTKMVLASVLASYLIELIGISLLILYTIFVLKVDYGNNIINLIIVSLNGALAGTSIGIFVGTLPIKENTKTGIMIASSMVFCFLSGMMGITMKYIIDTYVPILSRINPASMVTDALYASYYYTSNQRFIFDIVNMLLFSFVLISLSIRGMRRIKYDSI